MIKCLGMRNLKLVNFKLLIVHLNRCGSLKNLYLNTPNLKTLYFHGPRGKPCTIELINCKKLMNLHLVGVAMNTTMFVNCNESFPLLQMLTLAGCAMSGCINISRCDAADGFLSDWWGVFWDHYTSKTHVDSNAGQDISRNPLRRLKQIFRACLKPRPRLRFWLMCGL
ncbi:hypothetical protein HanPSC8_Chr00c275g0807321 [Helianthus annuus]|nr:hypothetical protein HanPSC8_Chr00c275g0807321 [Helianthus annuus]